MALIRHTHLAWIVVLGFVPLFLLDARSASHHDTPDPCVRPAGRTVADPPDLRSRDGLLNVDLAIHNHREADGSIRYCYTLSDGTQAPTLLACIPATNWYCVSPMP